MAIVAAAFLFSFVLTPIAGSLAARAGLVDLPGGRRIHHAPTPRGGGAAVIVSAAACIVVAEQLAGLVASGWVAEPLGIVSAVLASALAPWGTDAAGAAGAVWDAGSPSVFAGTAACFLLGLADDARHLRPWTKLAVQTAISVAVVLWSGIAIPLPPVIGILSAPATVFWLLLITNAFNLLDNMDGLCAGVAAIAAVFLALVALDAGSGRAAMAAACACGALLGFLVYNFHPARIFLGDAGSLSIGFFLSASAAAISQNCAAAHGTASGADRLAAAVLLFPFTLPLFDTASVMLIRLREGRPLLEGDTSHVSHRLLAAGLTRRETVLAMYLAALIAGIPTFLLPRGDAAGCLSPLLAAAVLVALGAATRGAYTEWGADPGGASGGAAAWRKAGGGTPDVRDYGRYRAGGGNGAGSASETGSCGKMSGGPGGPGANPMS